VAIDIQSAYAHLLRLSTLALGSTAPNPNVSALIYSVDGELISEGFHNRGTSVDHAEVVAIKAAKQSILGGTIVVSLEPCSHTGTTPPCVDAIIDAGITRVIFAVKDPNPVARNGAERLRAAGIAVEFHESPELTAIQGAWLHKIATARPYFIWKVATSLDGRIAAGDGSSQWISSPESRADVQVMRSQSDAILIGTGTALADNPTLRPRIDGATSPLRLVMGEREVPAGFNLHDQLSETLFIKSRSTADLLEVVQARPINQVLVEAGSMLGSALMAEGLIDEVVLYQAPILLGEGKTWLEGIGVSTIAEAALLTLLSQHSCGPDIKFRYRVEKR
jgi:diaminohydroxyphosphoribosylaminopyrimidine deaminase/5-amino-6-(5-phosphoribosylamino)uracil reductase